MSLLSVTGGGKNKNERKINHFYFYFILPKVRVGSPVKHFIKNKRPKEVWLPDRDIYGQTGRRRTMWSLWALHVTQKTSLTCKRRIYAWLLYSPKRKRKRSDSVLWQKPLHQQKCQKGKMTTQTTPQKSSITEQLRTDLGRSVGVTKVTQLVWLTWFMSPTFPLPQQPCNQKDTRLKICLCLSLSMCIAA